MAVVTGGTIEDAMAMLLTPALYWQEPYKLVLAVRTDLRMSTGKVAAQCVHAALGVLATIHTPGNGGGGGGRLRDREID
jgi:hypothetical protein